MFGNQNWGSGWINSASLFPCEDYLQQQQHINATISYYITSQSDKWQTSASQIFREGGGVQGW